MVYAKNYETASKFVKVMPKIPWPLFPDTVYKNTSKITKSSATAEKQRVSCAMRMST